MMPSRAPAAPIAPAAAAGQVEVARGGVAPSVALPPLLLRPKIAVPLAVILLTALAGMFCLAVAPHDPFAQNLLDRNQAPSATYWFGTDHLGRDVFSRLLLGARLSLSIALGGAVLALVIGGGIGLTAAAIGGGLDYVVFGFVDLLRALPGVLLAMLLIVGLGAGVVPVMVALGLTFAPLFARIARAVFHREASADYVAAARTFGSSQLRILSRHILPNVAGAFITQGAIVLPRCIVTESVLSFLGLGVAPDTPTWGRMIAQASAYVEVAPVSVLAPVLMLSLVTTCFALIGDQLRATLDPLRRVQRGER
jgi:ABC-type dipeptide/oligopeptide/nickel transport system permease subunit